VRGLDPVARQFRCSRSEIISNKRGVSLIERWLLPRRRESFATSRSFHRFGYCGCMPPVLRSLGGIRPLVAASTVAQPNPLRGRCGNCDIRARPSRAPNASCSHVWDELPHGLRFACSPEARCTLPNVVDRWQVPADIGQLTGAIRPKHSFCLREELDGDLIVGHWLLR
jgi:hypothetical protein